MGKARRNGVTPSAGRMPYCRNAASAVPASKFFDFIHNFRSTTIDCRAERQPTTKSWAGLRLACDACVSTAALVFLLAVDVVDEDAGTGRRDGHPFLAFERSPGVFVAALPMLAHRGAGKFVVLGVSLVGFLLVDDVED